MENLTRLDLIHFDFINIKGNRRKSIEVALYKKKRKEIKTFLIEYFENSKHSSPNPPLIMIR